MPDSPDNSDTLDGITQLTVEGFKSLADETVIDIRPLTLLAGANSSGKSSAMQPLLLMKQTLEAPFDPGPLLLDGPNMSFTSTSQLFTAISLSGSRSREFRICCTSPHSTNELIFEEKSEGLSIQQMRVTDCEGVVPQESVISHGMTLAQYKRRNQHPFWRRRPGTTITSLETFRNRCFLLCKVDTSVDATESNLRTIISGLQEPPNKYILDDLVEKIIHVPGLRDNPSRSYKTTAISDRFPGTFDTYVASVIQSWQRADDSRLPALVKQLQHMGLTRDVSAERINDTQVELRVAQEPIGSGGAARMINVADVGIGVSQVLPVLVAMLTAKPGQLVYIEQPEIHLHPRAQARLADAIIEASNRGVRVVIETHSQLLLLAIQTRIAEDEIDPENVMLHWFTRDERGVTSVASREPDEKGAFGDWPEDFSEVEMEWQNRYLDAAEKHLFG